MGLGNKGKPPSGNAVTREGLRLLIVYKAFTLTEGGSPCIRQKKKLGFKSCLLLRPSTSAHDTANTALVAQETELNQPTSCDTQVESASGVRDLSFVVVCPRCHDIQDAIRRVMMMEPHDGFILSTSRFPTSKWQTIAKFSSQCQDGANSWRKKRREPPERPISELNCVTAT